MYKALKKYNSKELNFFKLNLNYVHIDILKSFLCYIIYFETFYRFF